MQSQVSLSRKKVLIESKELIESSWEKLDSNQKKIAKKMWKVISFKWQWQIALNAPFLIIWVLDQTIPAVHKFDMKILASLPLPEWLSVLIG
tara:strand:- start:695 stop:970 length:276 start_codon:yes stop_codon:yes gene_type:complete